MSGDDDLAARLAAAGNLEESLDERRREAEIHARLFGEVIPVYIDRYRVSERLGAGAMGTVFAAHDERLDRPVAVKVLRERGASAAARVLREARSLARLTHPNVVTVYEVGAEADRTFIVMEYVPGQTLADWQEGRPWRAILGAYLDAGRGLAAVHDAGLVHRDFKPSNVLVGDDGRVRVADFGLVRALRAEALPSALAAPAPGAPMTSSGAVVGTPAYMAPEQLRGQSADQRADQFAFCASLYEALAGQRPFLGDTLAAVLGRMQAPPTPLDRPIPGPMNEVLARGLATRPEQRWPSMPALLHALEVVARRRRPWVFAVAALAVLGLAAWALWPPASAPPDPSAEAARPLPAALRHRPALAARVLLARQPADREWSAAARRILSSPLTERLVRPNRGPISEAISIGPEDLLLRFVDGSAARWTAGRLSPWPIDRQMAACRPPDARDDEAWPASWLARRGKGPSPPAACHRRGLVVFAAAGAELWPWEGPIQPLRRLPEGAHQIEPGGDGVLTHVDGRVLRTPLWREGPSEPLPGLVGVQVVALSSSQAAFALADGSVYLWRPGSRPRRLARVQGRLAGLRLSPNDRWLLGWVGGAAQIWETERGGEPFLLPSTWRPNVGGFDDHGRWLVLVASDGAATLWDLLAERAHPLEGHVGGVSCAGFSRGRLVTGGLDASVRVWNLEGLEGALIGRHDAAVWSGSLDPDGRRLATAGMDSTARIWSLDGGAPVVLRGHTSPAVFTTTFSPDGRLLATGSSDGSARIWLSDGGPGRVLPDHEVWAYGLAFSPDQALLATASRAGVVRLWPVDGGPARVLGDHGGPDRPRRVHSVAFSPDGRWLGSASKNGEVRLWPVRGGAPRLLTPHAGNAHLFYTRLGQLVTLGADTEVRLWSAAGEQLIRTFGPLAHPTVNAVSSPDGASLAVATHDGDVLVWAVADPQAKPRTLNAHRGRAEFLAFDAAGARLLVGTSTGQLRLWSLESGNGEELGGHLGGVRFVGFAPNGDPLSAGSDGCVRRWSVARDEASLRARLARATRVCLTPAQRAEWLSPDEAAAVTCDSDATQVE